MSKRFLLTALISLSAACTSTQASKSFNEQTTQKTIETKEAIYLKKLKKLISVAPLSVDAVTTTFGVDVIETIQENGENYTEFNENSFQNGKNAKLVWNSKTSRRSYSKDFNEQQICIKSSDVLAIFGESFKKNLMLNNNALINMTNLSKKIQSDYSLFELGPKYLFAKNNYSIELYFQFFLSECVRSVFIFANH